jgi:hypothetical protein
LQVSRVAQAEVLLRESATWILPEKLDAAISDALDNPTDLFQGGEPWHETLNRVPEYVEGLEGPQVLICSSCCSSSCRCCSSCPSSCHCRYSSCLDVFLSLPLLFLVLSLLFLISFAPLFAVTMVAVSCPAWSSIESCVARITARHPVMLHCGCAPMLCLNAAPQVMCLLCTRYRASFLQLFEMHMQPMRVSCAGGSQYPRVHSPQEEKEQKESRSR